jgi:hypothetical protein
MANKLILIIIKVVISIVVFFLMAAAHDFLGVPILAKNLIGFAVIGGIWAYNPSSQNDQNTTNP